MTKIALVLLLVSAGGWAAEPAWIFSSHDVGGYTKIEQAGKRGWLVVTVAIGHDPTNHSGDNFTFYANRGHGVIVRLNNGYGADGTLPYQSEYQNFATRCANYVAATQGADIFIIGNETNGAREWPGNVNGNPSTGEAITVARYVDCYNRCYTAIKAAKSTAQVMPAPSGTWGPPLDGVYGPNRGIEGFLDYWVNILNGVGASRIDALGLHCYTHGCDPALVTNTSKMGPPYQSIYYNFQVYRNYMAAIPTSMRSKPVYLTECDQNIECADGPPQPRHTWLNSNNGWVKAIYSEINTWNQNPANQKIRCVTLFRWDDVPEGEWSFGFSNRGGVVNDWLEAMANDYRWNTALPGTISGFVRDLWGSPIDQATVATSTGGYSTQTALDGSYTMTVAPGTYSVTASKAGYCPQTATNRVVTSSQTTTVNFSLVAGTSVGAITGYVRDAASNPLSGATVSASPGGYSAASGLNGYYVLTGLTPAAYAVTASKSGYVSATQTNKAVTAGNVTSVDFSLNVLKSLARISQAKLELDGTWVSVPDVVLSRASGQYLVFLQDADRSCGIRVMAGTGSIPAMTPGQRCTVQGRLTSGSNVRRITDVTITTGAPGTVWPVALSNRSVGGSDYFYSAGPPASGQKGMSGSAGPNNIGLLVKTWGRVLDAPSGGIVHLYDGSAAGGVPIRLGSGVTAPAQGSFVSIAGIPETDALLVVSQVDVRVY